MASSSDCEALGHNLADDESEMAEIASNQNLDSESYSSGDGEGDSLLPGFRPINTRNKPPPVDRFKAVYLIFYLMGIGTLLPWNMFITAKDYFMYQLRNTTAPADHYKDADDQTPFQLSYESAIAVSNMIPNLLLQILNTSLAGSLHSAVYAFSTWVSMNKRIVCSMIIMILMFILTLIFTRLNVTLWQSAFYGLTLTTVVFSSAASALLSSSLFGLAARFPQTCTQAVMGGMGLGGVFSAVADIITLSLGTSVELAAFWYFMLAVIVIALSVVAYLFMGKLKYARYYNSQDERMTLVDSTTVTRKSFFGQYLSIFKIIWPYSLSVVLVFFVTLALFPSITSEVQSVHASDGSIWTGKYFLVLYCFLLFNAGDLAGRTLASWISLPKPRVVTLVLSVLRLLFVPLFILCNAQPRGSLPVVFNSDVYPIVIMVVFSISNGFLSTVALMLAPTLVEKHQAEMTGTMMSLSMTIGLSLGSAVSYAFVVLVKDL